MRAVCTALVLLSCSCPVFAEGQQPDPGDCYELRVLIEQVLDR
nr:hypothetical protein [Mycobacterium uberis]